MEARSLGASALDFATPRRGVLRTPDGSFRTGDGGRTFAYVPTPAGAHPAVVAPNGAGRVTAVEGTGLVFRTSLARSAAKPTVTARRAGPPRRAGRTDRRVTVSGRVRGAPEGARVVLVTAPGPRADGVPSASTVVNADGTYRLPVLLGRRERVVRAWYAGDVGAAATTPSAASGPVVVPALPGARGRTGR